MKTGEHRVKSAVFAKNAERMEPCERGASERGENSREIWQKQARLAQRTDHATGLMGRLWNNAQNREKGKEEEKREKEGEKREENEEISKGRGRGDWRREDLEML